MILVILLNYEKFYFYHYSSQTASGSTSSTIALGGGRFLGLGSQCSSLSSGSSRRSLGAMGMQAAQDNFNPYPTQILPNPPRFHLYIIYYYIGYSKSTRPSIVTQNSSSIYSNSLIFFHRIKLLQITSHLNHPISFIGLKGYYYIINLLRLSSLIALSLSISGSFSFNSSYLAYLASSDREDSNQWDTLPILRI